MSDLIARLGAASEGSRALDWEIHVRNGLDGVGMHATHPAYTTSLDAALTLVPDGWDWQVEGGTPPMCAMVSDNGGKFLIQGDQEFYAYHKTSPALALCIASLKARAKGAAT